MKSVMRINILAYAIIVGLTSCDAVTNQAAEMAVANEPTIVLPAGYRIEVAGHSVPIQGFDECPAQNALMAKIFGSAPDEGSSTCIVLGKDRTKVSVLVALPTGLTREDWDIIRDAGKTESGKAYSRMRMRRPDGSFVVPATESRS